jgi:hypothetical protein
MISSVPRSPKLYPAVDLGPLPVAKINVALGTELEPGRVRLSEQAHRHIAENHPDDYAVCFPALAEAIAAPSFIGQAPRRTGNFEMLRRINHPDGKLVLVAVGLEMDGIGDYRVRSRYLVSAEQVDQRRRDGRLKPPPPKPTEGSADLPSLQSPERDAIPDLLASPAGAYPSGPVSYLALWPGA